MSTIPANTIIKKINMFTIQQIHEAHSKVKSGVDFQIASEGFSETLTIAAGSYSIPIK